MAEYQYLQLTVRPVLPVSRVNFDRAVRDLDKVTRHKSLLPGDTLFSLGEPSVELYLIESGSINLRVVSSQTSCLRPVI